MSDKRPGGDNTDDPGRARHPGARWRKSSFSSSNGDCIEVASLSNYVGVRDSKAITDPNPCLLFPPRAWSAFVGNIRQQAYAPPGSGSILQ